MIDPSLMLLLATALIRTVRQRIEFSENIPQVDALFVDSVLYKKKMETMDELTEMPLDINNLTYALTAWERGVGYCDELSRIIIQLSRFIKIDWQERVFLTLLCTPKHVFCVLHQDAYFHYGAAQTSNNFVTDNFYAMRNFFPANSIIVDPWINKATLMEVIKAHRVAIENYSVHAFYMGGVTTAGYSVAVGMEHAKPTSKIMQTILARFNYYFFTKPSSKIIDHQYGKPFQKMQNKFYLSACWEELKQIEKFIREINLRRLRVLGSCGNNLKTLIFQEALEYIEICASRKNPPEKNNLKIILLRVLKITVMIREKNAPARLDAATLAISQTGKILMDVLTSGNGSPSFSSLEIFEIKRLRSIILNAGPSIHNRHFALCRYLHEKDIADFLQKANPSQSFLQPSYIPNRRFHSNNLALALSDAQNRQNPHPLTYLYSPQYLHYCCLRLREAMTETLSI